MIARRIQNIILDDVVALLRESPDVSRYTVCSQNDQDLAALIQEEDGKLDGVVVVVSVDTVAKIASKPARYDVSFSVNVTEFVPVNRESPDFETALDVVMECGELIDEAHVGHFERLRHSTPGDGILNAVAECRGEFTVTQ